MAFTIAELVRKLQSETMVIGGMELSVRALTVADRQKVRLWCEAPAPPPADAGAEVARTYRTAYSAWAAKVQCVEAAVAMGLEVGGEGAPLRGVVGAGKLSGADWACAAAEQVQQLPEAIVTAIWEKSEAIGAAFLEKVEEARGN